MVAENEITQQVVAQISFDKHLVFENRNSEKLIAPQLVARFAKETGIRTKNPLEFIESLPGYLETNENLFLVCHLCGIARVILLPIKEKESNYAKETVCSIDRRREG